jgi:uncharacterized protein
LEIIRLLGVKRKDPEHADFFAKIIDTLYVLIYKSYYTYSSSNTICILAIITKVAAPSNYEALVKLGKFAIASYVAIIIMFIIHLLLLFFAKLSPTHYVKKGFPTLTFAFSSRSSAGTLPFSIKTQTKISVCLKELRTLLVLLAFQPVKMVMQVFIRPC